MTTCLPLARYGIIQPIMRGIEARGLDPAPFLQAAGIAAAVCQSVYHPLPLRSGIRLANQVTREISPTFVADVVSKRSLYDLGGIGDLARPATSPGKLLRRVAGGFRLHGSHDQLTVEIKGDRAVVRHFLRVPLDAEALYVSQLYTAALILSALQIDGKPRPSGLEISLVPHPDFGVAGVGNKLDVNVTPSTSAALEVRMPTAVLEREYERPDADDLPSSALEKPPQIRGDGTLTASIRAVLPDLLAVGRGGADDIAELAYMSRRTLQRRLEKEGTSLSTLVAGARQGLALAALIGGDQPVGAIASSLGYGSVSSLSRSMRRWTGQAPRAIRQTAGSEEDAV